MRYTPQSHLLVLLSHPSHRVQVHPSISTTPQSPLTQGPGTSPNLNYPSVTPHTGSRYISQSQLLLSHPSHRVQVHPSISTTPQSPLTQGPGTSPNLNYSSVTPHTGSRYIPQPQLLLSHPSHRVQVHPSTSTTPQSPLTQGPGTSPNLNYSSVTPHTGSRYIPQSQLLLSHPSHRVQVHPPISTTLSHPSHRVQVHPSISTTPQSPLTQGPGTSPNLNSSVTPHTGSRYIPQSQLLLSHPSHRVQVHPPISTTPQSPLTQGPGTSLNLNYSSVTPHTGSRYIPQSQLLLSHPSHRVQVHPSTSTTPQSPLTQGPGTSPNLNYSSVTPHTGSRYIPQSQLLLSHTSHRVQVHPPISTTPQSPLTQGPGTSPNLNYSQSPLTQGPGTSLNLNYSSVTPHTGSRYVSQSQLLSHPSHRVQVHPPISTTPQSPLTQGPGTSPNLNYSSVTPHTGSRYIPQPQLLLSHPSHRVQVHPPISTTPQSPLTQGPGTSPNLNYSSVTPHTGSRYIPQSQLLLSHPSHRVQVHPPISTTISHPSHRVQVHPSISTTPQSPLTQGPGTSLNLNYSSVTPHTGSRYIPQSQLLLSHPSHRVQVHPSISTTPKSPLTQGPGTSPNLNYYQSPLTQGPGTSLNLNYSSVTPHTGSRYIPQSQLLLSHPSHRVQVHPSISTTPKSPLTQGPGTSLSLNYSSVTPHTGSRYIPQSQLLSVTPHTGFRYIPQSQLLLSHPSHRVQVHPSISTTPQSLLTQGPGTCNTGPILNVIQLNKQQQ